MKYTIRIGHLYGDLMNTYGDDGNIISIQKRCAWRRIATTVETISIGDKLQDQFDLFFFGGGQDRQQEVVGKDLPKKEGVLKKAVNGGVALLSICGGFQLLSAYYQPFDGPKIPGIGLFPAYTVAGERRMIGNLFIRLNPALEESIRTVYSGKADGLSTLVGFENHSGKTYLDHTARRLGTVIRGNGNNGEDGTEGMWLKNAFGCYLHGPLLPKNPHVADYLIAKALAHRYGKEIVLHPLDDTEEWDAHAGVLRLRR